MPLSLDDIKPNPMPKGWAFVNRHTVGSHSADFYLSSEGLKLSVSVEHPSTKPSFMHFAFSYETRVPSRQDMADALAALFKSYTEDRTLTSFGQKHGLHPYTVHVHCELSTQSPQSLN